MEKLLEIYKEKQEEGLDKHQSLQSALKEYTELDDFNVDIARDFIYTVLELK